MNSNHLFIINESQHNSGNLTLIQDSLLMKSRFKEIVFRKLTDSTIYSMNNSKKKIKIILIYFYVLGTYYDNLFKEFILKYENNNNVELKIIVGDFQKIYFK